MYVSYCGVVTSGNTEYSMIFFFLSFLFSSQILFFLSVSIQNKGSNQSMGDISVLTLWPLTTLFVNLLPSSTYILLYIFKQQGKLCGSIPAVHACWLLLLVLHILYYIRSSFIQKRRWLSAHGQYILSNFTAANHIVCQYTACSDIHNIVYI